MTKQQYFDECKETEKTLDIFTSEVWAWSRAYFKGEVNISEARKEVRKQSKLLSSAMVRNINYEEMEDFQKFMWMIEYCDLKIKDIIVR